MCKFQYELPVVKVRCKINCVEHLKREEKLVALTV